MMSERILLVEDDLRVAQDIRRWLERIGHEVLAVAARGENTDSLVLRTRPDLVLMDMDRGREFDGVDAAASVRERLGVPVFVLTAYAADGPVRQARLTEPFGDLPKLFEDLQLRVSIEIALYAHRIEGRLRDSERRYAATLASMRDAVIAMDADGHVAFLNPVAQSLTGWSQEEAIGRAVTKVFRILDEQTRETREDPAAEALRLGATVNSANGDILVARDGREVLIDDWGSPILDEFGETTGAVLVFRDALQRHRGSDELLETRETLERFGRLTAMGELTVSIAHKVNQSLMAIVTNAAACLQWLTPENLNIEEAQRAAERVTRDGHRAGEVIANIRALARKSPPEPMELDLNATILEVLRLMCAELRRHAIAAETDLATDFGPARADRNQFQLVIVNLIVNAIDAIKAAEHSPRLLRIRSQQDDPGYILIAVSDTGDGLDPESGDRIFDAFFTTKPEGVGMVVNLPFNRRGARRSNMGFAQ